MADDLNSGLTAEEEESLAEAFSKEAADRIGASSLDPNMDDTWALLLSADGENLSDKLISALTDIFNKFDSDKDGSWDEKDLGAYFKATNGEAMTDEERDEVVGTFYENGKMPLESFLDMYTLQTCSRPEDTIADVKKHGYKDDLTKV